MITHTHTYRKVVFPKQWYTQRARSESYASSDMEQYQDASDCLTLEVSNINLSPSSEIIASSPTTTKYLELGLGHAPEYLGADHGHTSLELGHTHSHTSEYLELDHGHTSLEICHTHSHTSTEYLELSSGHTHNNASSVSMDSFADATGEVIIVANDVEVSSTSCDEVGESGAVMADQSEASERNSEGSLENNGD